MGRNAFNILITGGATLGSRFLGLLRDILIFSLFGASALHSAFIIAFTLPNLFRRLLGEGALTSALVPVFSEEVERHGRKAGFGLLNKLLSRVALVLLGLLLVGVGLLVGAQSFVQLSPRWLQAAHLGVILMPYMPLVCGAAVLGGTLNVLGRFAVTAFSPVWLNLTMIAVLGALIYGWDVRYGSEDLGIYVLCGGVLAGGVLQAGTAAGALLFQGWRPCFDWRKAEGLSEIQDLWIPGLAGAAVLQVNVLVSRLLAFSLNEGAVAFLYLANRLMELPLGVFTLAVVTVAFPNLARLAARGDERGFTEAFYRGLQWILAVSVPAALGLLLLGRPIVGFLFEWGRFEVDDVATARSVVGVFALGLPFYSLATLATRGLHALKAMWTVALGSGLSFGVNLGMSLVLMRMWEMEGLALANVLAAGVHSIWLYGRLKQRCGVSRFDAAFMEKGTLLRIGAAAAVMGVVCWVGLGLIEGLWGGGKFAGLVTVMGLIPLASVVYFVLLGLLGFDERLRLSVLWQRRRRLL